MAEITIERDTDQQRYVARRGGELLGSAAFTEDDDAVTFTHTEVDPRHEGQGVAGVLVRDALDDVLARGKQVVPVCSFVAGYVRRHPEYASSVRSGGPQ